MTFDYDLFVIGAGSGGVRAGRVAAAQGAKVAIAEESRYGGTCVIRGCVPKKLMVFASGYGRMAAEGRAYGWDIEEKGFDWDAFKVKLNAELDRLEGVYQRLLDGSGVEKFHQRATLVDAHTVALADGTTKTAKHILIATGGRPVRPAIPGAELGLVSDDIFDMPTLPKRVLIVGGGYIGCEFAGILNGLGSEVTQFYRGEQVLRGFDNEARDLIATEMRAAGIDLRTGIDVTALEQDGAAIKVAATDGESYSFDAVIFATGRKPNTDGLGLEGANVGMGAKGQILVDDYSQTAVPSIYAIGDVTDRVQLTPVAIREGMAFVETVFKGNATKPDHELIPTAVFTQPELGTVGLSEEEALASSKEPLEIYTTSFKPMQQSFAGTAAQKILMKLVVAAESRTVLGCHIVGPSAGEMIQLAGIAVKMGATKEDFDRTVAVHPTAAEELVTMKTPTRILTPGS
ncbi:glutathione-disulfide reductase [Pseudooceanicola sp. CBS1P-1]|uniref:Glutathione reductase n=1 Tax=Pseudooceanicola albus TaxID=2692189 RepID=A0A6L7G4E6_9RHOB|nr:MULTISPECIES: glutathione-disulfide reductase [Pseudooceanicola]MBT9385605.1 glutathione-disulfide reductase [Pseudooceanicola endophyticus]MXN18985.1 glutathione-disulfide reductase [Pseudooceanicola albus]